MDSFSQHLGQSVLYRQLSEDESVQKAEKEVVGDEVIELPPVIPEVEKEVNVAIVFSKLQICIHVHIAGRKACR